MTARALAFALLLVLSAAGSVLAEFGPESPDGFPLGADGKPIHPPVAPLTMDSPLNKLGPLTVYPYYPLLTLEVERLARDHPDLVKLTSAGKSTAGLDLWLLEIADFSRIESGEGIPLEDRELLYIDGGTHSNEYSGVYFVVEIAQFLLDEYETNETARWIVENRHTFILPLVNPDGSNAFGRLNAMTVNINRNYPATWGTVDEVPIVNNPGPEPESEPETRAVTALMDKLRPDYVNSIHCCGKLFLHPWGAEQIPEPADVEMYTRICDEAFPGDLRKSCGPIWSTIYPASGTTADEGYGRVGASSWTYEMLGNAAFGPWGEPVVSGQARDLEKEAWAGVMHAFHNVQLYGAHPVIRSVSGDADALRVVIENDGYGPLTSGELKAGAATVALPSIPAGESAVVEVPGAFAAGEVPMSIDFVKRVHLEPRGLASVPVRLVRDGGELRGVLPTATSDVPLETASAQAGVPAAAPIAVLALLALAAVASRRRGA